VLVEGCRDNGGWWRRCGGVLGRGLRVEWVVGGEERADGVGDGTGVLVLLSHLHRGWDGSSR
jgi:hypothetical protein